MAQAPGWFGRITAVFIATLVLNACGAAGPSAGISESIPPSPRNPPSLGQLSPAPTATHLLEIDGLPEASFDPATLTALCDPEAGQTDMGAGDAKIYCSDGLAIGLRVIMTVTSGPIERLYFQRPTCQTTPCTDDELSTATVTAWTATRCIQRHGRFATAHRADADARQVRRVAGGSGLHRAGGRTPPHRGRT